MSTRSLRLRAEPLLALADRLSAIAFCDPIGQAALCVLAFLGYALVDLPYFLGKASLPFEFAFSVEVAGPVLFSLLVGTLLVLDHRNRTRDQIIEMLGDGENLSVSSTLGLSSTDLQASYHHWLSQVPAVRYHPLIVLAMQLVVHLQLALKPEEAQCRWAPNLMALPSTIMLVVRLVLDRVPAAGMPMRSMASFASTAIIATYFAVMLAIKNPCYLSFLSIENPGLLLTASQAVLHSAMGFIMSPIDMDYVPALAMLIFCTRGPAVYFQFLHLHGGFKMSSDPNLWGLLTVIVSAALTCQISVAIRYNIAGANLNAFIDCLRKSR